MHNLPSLIYSGAYKEGHVQGVAVDKIRGFVYYSFTTMLLKTDLDGRAVGSVINLAGHLGCIAYDAERNRVYGSLELKHDIIGSGIISRIGKNPSDEDNFYLVSFDCDSIVSMDMDAEGDGVMLAVHLADICNDYKEQDDASGRKHRYGCSGCDGTGYGPVFGEGKDTVKKIMIAYGIYSETDRADNDYQVILQYDTSIFDTYGKSLDQSRPHKSGPPCCEERYFFYTGNTNFGVQNLEYDEYLNAWLVAVYRGEKEEFTNFPMFLIDGARPAVKKELIGRCGEMGLVLEHAGLGYTGKKPNVYGVHIRYGSTGMASLGGGRIYFSEDASLGNGEYCTNVRMYDIKIESTDLFERREE